MMNNIFSEFDPLGMSPFSIFNNWSALFLILIFLPVKSNASMNSFSILLGNSIMSLTEEISHNMKNSVKMHMFFLSIFFFFFLCNFYSMMPYIFAPSAHLALGLTLSVVICSAFFIYMFIILTKKSMIHLTPAQTPSILIPFMVLIELLSTLIRPITLALRMTANITAGHIIMSMLLSYSPNKIVSLLMIMGQTPLILMEFMVSIIQAYIFMTLVTLYMSESSD